MGEFVSFEHIFYVPANSLGAYSVAHVRPNVRPIDGRAITSLEIIETWCDNAEPDPDHPQGVGAFSARYLRGGYASYHPTTFRPSLDPVL